MSGGQPLSIGTGCGFIGTVLHELMHALGFFHTSSRHDRDSYVVVISKNIMKGKYIKGVSFCGAASLGGYNRVIQFYQLS